MKSVYWLRTDLRILDNEALTTCLQNNQEVIFVFAETKSLKRAGPIRKKFVYDCLTSLQSELEEQGNTVLKTELTLIDYLSTLQKNHPFDSLYFTQEYSWEERQEEGRVQSYCQNYNIAIHSFEQGTLIAQRDLPFPLEEMPFVFTDFRKKIELQLKIKPLVTSPFAHEVNQGLARLNHYLWESHAIEQY